MNCSNRTPGLAPLAPLAVLSASIAHAMREPLTAIALEAGTVQRRLRGACGAANAGALEDVSEGLRRIQEQAARADAQMRCLHKLMRIEDGVWGTAHGECSTLFALDAAILEAVALARVALYDAGLDLQVEIAPALARVEGERARVQHAVLGLLAEALTERAGRNAPAATLRLAVGSCLQGGASVHLALESTTEGATQGTTEGTTMRRARLPIVSVIAHAHA
ncbi:sensor histidine kinase [Cupriavidus pampae]|uniref:Signal transduction histidine kinase dimerisation/phosphoacceptor domain-containing protein n=1 Tax=Cupriavidus pampae TaxID=659251 RepID=A0ABM8XYH5_9BURK|nr:hypothetical protein [Cupriavidus pampae]CAG9185425.1 hypothetical protein LMG32289_05953 [Cupriavidus pampae]